MERWRGVAGRRSRISAHAGVGRVGAASSASCILSHPCCSSGVTSRYLCIAATGLTVTRARRRFCDPHAGRRKARAKLELPAPLQNLNPAAPLLHTLQRVGGVSRHPALPPTPAVTSWPHNPRCRAPRTHSSTGSMRRGAVRVASPPRARRWGARRQHLSPPPPKAAPPPAWRRRCARRKNSG